MTLEQHALRIKELREKGMHIDALAYFKEHIDKQYGKAAIGQNRWLVADIVQCLRKTGKAAEGLRFYLHYLKMDSGQIDNVRLRSELGWSLFAILRDGQELPHAAALQAYYLHSLNHAKDGLLFTALFWKLLSAELALKEPKYSLLKEALQNHSPGNLSAEPQKLVAQVKGREKEISLASDRQRWFVEMAKVQYMLKEYQECIQTVENAFAMPIDLQPDAAFWLMRRKYHAMAGLGNFDGAAHGLQQLIGQKHDWFLFKDLAEIWHCAGNMEMSHTNALIACLLPGKLPYKVSLFEFMCQHLDLGQARQAHQVLVAYIRQQNEWKLSPAQQQLLDATPNPGQSNKETLNYWMETLKNKNILMEGEIGRILHPGPKGDGFINYGQGQKAYFRISDVEAQPRDVLEKANVFFMLKKSSFKGKTTDVAYRVLLEKGSRKPKIHTK
jgi:hypothetical protein